jgi:hypothetical protein
MTGRRETTIPPKTSFCDAISKSAPVIFVVRPRTVMAEKIHDQRNIIFSMIANDAPRIPSLAGIFGPRAKFCQPCRLALIPLHKYLERPIDFTPFRVAKALAENGRIALYATFKRIDRLSALFTRLHRASLPP